MVKIDQHLQFLSYIHVISIKQRKFSFPTKNIPALFLSTLSQWVCRILHPHFKELFPLLLILQYLQNSNSCFTIIFYRFSYFNWQFKGTHSCKFTVWDLRLTPCKILIFSTYTEIQTIIISRRVTFATWMMIIHQIDLRNRNFQMYPKNSNLLKNIKKYPGAKWLRLIFTHNNIHIKRVGIEK